MNISETGIKFIKTWEGRRLKAYQDQGGVWTCGYGSTGPDITKDTVFSPEEAEKRLIDDISSKAEPIRDFVKVTLSENQFAALCSLCFNVGVHRVIKSKTFKLINQNKDPSVEWLGFCLINGVPSNGLLRRRKAELQLYKS